MDSTIPATHLPRSPAVRATATVHAELTTHALSVPSATSFVRTPAAGATVLFVGTTRSTFGSRVVASLAYSAYVALALRTLFAIASETLAKHGCERICIVHRLGLVPVGEESILIAVSAAHRNEAWRAGEEALEEVKRKAEVWKLEQFQDGEGLWKANADAPSSGQAHDDGAKRS